MKRFKQFLKTKFPILIKTKYSLTPIIMKFTANLNPKGTNIYSNSAKQNLKHLHKSEETCKYCTIVPNYINWVCSNNPKETDWNWKI